MEQWKKAVFFLSPGWSPWNSAFICRRFFGKLCESILFAAIFEKNLKNKVCRKYKIINYKIFLKIFYKIWWSLKKKKTRCCINDEKP